MRVAINAIDFYPGSMGGIETYIRNLWEHLQQVDTRLWCTKSNTNYNFLWTFPMQS